MRCDRCHFWSYLDDRRGECFVAEVPESTIDFVVREETEPGIFTPIIPNPFDVTILTPPDHFCSLFQLDEDR